MDRILKLFPEKFSFYHIMWMIIALQFTVFVMIMSHPGEDVKCVEELGQLYCNNPIDLNK